MSNYFGRIIKKSDCAEQAIQYDFIFSSITQEVSLAKENKPNHDLNNTTPMSTNEPLKEKIDQKLEEENSSATDKSPDDIEVDNILSNSKSDQQNTEHRTIVSC